MQNILIGFTAGCLFAWFARLLSVWHKRRLEEIRAEAERRVRQKYEAEQRKRDTIRTAKQA